MLLRFSLRSTPQRKASTGATGSFGSVSLESLLKCIQELDMDDTQRRRMEIFLNQKQKVSVSFLSFLLILFFLFLLSFFPPSFLFPFSMLFYFLIHICLSSLLFFFLFLMSSFAPSFLFYVFHAFCISSSTNGK